MKDKIDYDECHCPMDVWYSQNEKCEACRANESKSGNAGK